ncbi:MAG: hypothetical protein LBJ67_05900 [Planctomycetaceae bacterium]|nr:hypothetical protein [Planctomycetaceae bacterium]
MQDKIDDMRRKAWLRQSSSFFSETIVDRNGTLAPTDGECKQSIDALDQGE